MKTEHTPGPWKTFGLEVGQSRRNLICTLYQQAGDCVSMGTEKTKANARLIAAAPELLEALKDCQVQLAEYVEWHQKRGGCSVEIESAEEQARLAIARATREAEP